MVRALNQRQNQAPMRFFEAGTHGQPINNPNRPYKERPEDVIDQSSVGRVHPTQQRGGDLDMVETVQGPRRADMAQPNLGRGGRRRDAYPRGNPRDDMWWRLHEGIGEGVLFDEDPEETEDTSVARNAPGDPLWKNYGGRVQRSTSVALGGGKWSVSPEEREEIRATTQQRQEANRRYLAGRVGDPVGGQRRIAEQIDAAIRGLNPELLVKVDSVGRKREGFLRSESPEHGPLVRSAPQPEEEVETEEAVETFRHPGGPYFDQGTKGMWTDAAAMLLPAWVSGVAVGVGATGLWNDRRTRKAEENKRPLDASREEPRYRPRSQG